MRPPHRPQDAPIRSSPLFEARRSALGVTRALITLAVVAACGGSTDAPPPCVVASVGVSPASASLTPGGTQTLSASINSSNCTTAPTASWSSSAPNVATVTPAGLVTAVATGNTTITATAGAASGTASITVAPPPVASVTVTLASATLAIGGTTTATAVARTASNTVLTDRTTIWSSSNAAIAAVGATGTVTAVAPGVATIRATVDGVAGQATLTVLSRLTVASVSPADGASAISIETTFRLTFSASIDPATVTAATVTLTSGGVAVPATRAVSGNVVTVTPSPLLTEFSTAYVLSATTGVKSTTGTSLASNGSASYTSTFWDPNYVYRITNQFSGPSKALDTYSDSRQCFMGDTGGYSGQFWYFIPRGGGVSSMQNLFGGDTLGIEGADTGTPCFLVNGGLPNQVNFSGMAWRAIPITGIAGYYYLRPASTTTKSLATLNLVPQLATTPPSPVVNSSMNWTFTREGRR